MPKTLGQNLYVTGWCLDCRMTLHEVEGALQYLVSLIEMDTGGMPCQISTFPLNGKGGLGITAVQPLVESFSLGLQPAGVAINDTWTDHHHCFFLIASCKPYSKQRISEWFHENLGHIISSGEFDLYGKGGVFKGSDREIP